MSYATRSSKYRTYQSWSTQFGLYKYQGAQPLDDFEFQKESVYKKFLRFILVSIMALIILTVVCLMVFDFSAAVDPSILDGLNKISIGNEDNNIQTHTISIFPKQKTITTEEHDIHVEENVDFNDTNTALFSNSSEIFIDGEPLFDLEGMASDSKITAKGLLGSPFHLLNSKKSVQYNTNTPAPSYRNSYNLNYPQLSNFRNEQKSKNVDELLRYMNDQLNKEDNKKNNPSRRIKFSGIYLQPRKNHPRDSSIKRNDSNVYENMSYRRNLKYENSSVHSPTEFTRSVNSNKSDPFVQYKPKMPGDINLLAENKFRFAPSSSQNKFNRHRFTNSLNKNPMRNDFTKCNSYKCSVDFSKPKKSLIQNSDEDQSNPVDYYLNGFNDSNSNKKSSKVRGHSKTRPLSVMLDIYPMENQDEETMAYPEHLNEPVSTTTTTRRPRPLKPYPSFNPYTGTHVHPNFNNYPTYIRPPPYPSYFYPGRYQNPRIVNQPKIHTDSQRVVKFPPVTIKNDHSDRTTNNTSNTSRNKPTQMLVHLNLYPRKKIVKNVKVGDDTYGIIDRKSHPEKYENEFADSQSSGSNVEPTVESNTVTKLLRDVNIENLESNQFNITVDDIRKGYGFKLPGPDLDDFTFPDGISNPAIQLLTLSSSINNGLAPKSNIFNDENFLNREITEQSKILDDVNMSSAETSVEINDENNNSTLEMGDDFDFYKSLNSSTSLDEFIAVPLLD